MKLIYVAHPFGGDQRNADSAEQICAEFMKIFDAIFWAPWLPLVRNWRNNAESLERGLAIDIECVKRSDQVWFVLVNGVMSPGQEVESAAAIEANIPRFYFTPDQIAALPNDSPILFAALQEAIKSK